MSSDEPTITNRPGQTALSYRITTRAQSSERMRALRSRFAIPSGPNQGQRPLAALTSEHDDDPALGLLDAWATTLDVLSFYQERIANEGFLRTATERRSALELSRSIGYELRPGLSAGAYLTFTLEDADIFPGVVTIPAGTRVQSVPAKSDQPPQVFETAKATETRAEWNQLVPRLCDWQLLGGPPPGAAPKFVKLGGALGPNKVPVLQPLPEPPGIPTTTLYFEGDVSKLRRGDPLHIGPINTQVASAEYQSTQARTKVTLKTPVYLRAPMVLDARPTSIRGPLKLSAENVRLYVLGWRWEDESLTRFLREQGWSTKEVLRQVAALSAADAVSLDSVISFKQRVACFGNTAPAWSSLAKPDSTYYRGTDLYSAASSSWDDANGNNSRTVWQDSWGRRNVDRDPSADIVLDRQVAEIVEGSYVLLAGLTHSAVFTVKSAMTATFQGYGTTIRTTALDLDVEATGAEVPGTYGYLTRNTVVYADSEQLTVTSTRPLAATETVREQVTLDRMVLGLGADRTAILTGERADFSGVTDSVLVTISRVVHEGGFTTLYFSAPTAYAYLKSSVTLNANVLYATHGETIQDELLGSGDSAQSNQRFTLKRAPLTYLPSNGGLSGKSTLEVRVNGIKWREVLSLLDEDGHSTCYKVSLDGDGNTVVSFGNGQYGARLPTGENNVVATYRCGGGSAGLVAAGALRLLLDTPLGVRSAINPIAASGGADSQVLDEAQALAPQDTLSASRAVSLSDYQVLAQNAAGIAKVFAQPAWIGGAQTVHLTVAAEGGEALTASSPIAQSLYQLLRALGSPTQQVFISDHREKTFQLQAQLVVDPAYTDSEVLESVRAALNSAFSFDSRALMQPVRSSEIIHTMQQVPGVRAALLSALYFGSTPSYSPLLVAEGARFDLAPPLGAELLVISLAEDDLTVIAEEALQEVSL